MTTDIDVVIPAYNAEATIGRAVLSALASGAAQVIVVDDGSDDGTVAAAQAAGARVIRQANTGAAQARRAGVALSTAAFTVLLDADDRLIPSGVRASVRVATAAGMGCSVVFGRTIGVRRDGTETPFAHWEVPVTTQELLRRGYSPCPPAAMLWRRAALGEALSGSVPAVWPRYAEDYELLIRGSLGGAVARHDAEAAYYALDGGKSMQLPRRSLECSEEIRRHYAEILGIPIAKHGAWGIRSRALVRQAKSMQFATAPARKSAYLAAAAAMDPLFFGTLAMESVRRRFRAAT